MSLRGVHDIDAAVVERVARREFPKESDVVLSLLSEYGREEWQREVFRVRAAILYGAKGCVDDLLDLIAAACVDYRDVLLWVEYANHDEGPDVQARDEERYLRWLEKD